MIVVLLIVGRLLVEDEGDGGGRGGESSTTPPSLRTTTRDATPPPDAPEGYGPSLVLDVEFYVCDVFGRLRVCVSKDDGRCVIRRPGRTSAAAAARKALGEVEACLGLDVFVEI